MLKKRNVKSLILIFLDSIFVVLAYILAMYIRLGNVSDAINYFKENIVVVTLSVFIYIVVFAVFKQYKKVIRVASVEEFSLGMLSAVISGTINLLVSLVISVPRISMLVTVTATIFVILFCNGIRIGWRVIIKSGKYLNENNDKVFKNIMIFGAGSSGALVLKEFRKNPKIGKKVVAFIDDDAQKKGTYICGVKVYGNRNEINKIVDKLEIDEIIIAISELEGKELKEIIEVCKVANLPVKLMPGVSEMIEGKFELRKIREVNLEDLLGRGAINLDHSGIADYIKDKVVMVTGGGGSIGSELCRQIVTFRPKTLIILDIYENNAYEIQTELVRKYKDLDLKTLIASVRDKERMEYIFNEYKPQVVFHAAAHKHVPLMEESPGEAIKNNVVGTLNTAELASKYNVERFVLISTDKAVNPTNVMGATKRLCEMIIQAVDRESNTEFVAVRFGNVLGSNGSVVPLFKKQIADGGPVWLTHKDITRYFMLIPEAAQLVLQAGAYAKGGEIFVLDMGEPVKIYDLAENLIKLSGYKPGEDIEIKITGLRPGEKLYEELLMSEEGLKETKNDKIFIGIPGDFEIKTLKSKIRELEQISIKSNMKNIREKLSEIVPTYKEIKL